MIVDDSKTYSRNCRRCDALVWMQHATEECASGPQIYVAAGLYLGSLFYLSFACLAESLAFRLSRELVLL